MDPADVEQVTVEVAKLGFLGSEQTEQVLDEFYQICMTNKAVTEGGLEYAAPCWKRRSGSKRPTACWTRSPRP